MAIAGPFQKVLDDLEAEKTLIANCTLTWKTLADHLSSLHQTLADRSQALDSKIQSHYAQTQKTLESIDSREESIPTREAAAAALIAERRDAVVSEMPGLAESRPAEDVHVYLRLHCRMMDSSGLWRLLVLRRKELWRKEISDAVSVSVDPARLVLDAVEDFVADENTASVGCASDRCWALGMLLSVIMNSDGGRVPELTDSVVEKAAAVAEGLKVKLQNKVGGGEEGGMAAAEALTFLHMVVAFGLSSKFDGELLRKLVVEHSSRREIAKLAAELGFGEKMADIIEELVNSGKVIEAVYFAHESGLTERFSPIPLIKTFLQSSRKNASTILRNGNNSAAAIEESSSIEFNANKSIIKCVENLNLEAKFNLEGLRKRSTLLEKSKADRNDRKRTEVASRFQKKRMRTANHRMAKSIRTADATYPSFHRNTPAAHSVPPARHPYNYSGQGSGFDGHAAASSMGPVYSQNPALAPQQYYVPDDMAGGARAAVPYSGPSIGYAGYDYATPHAAPQQQPAYPHQH